MGLPKRRRLGRRSLRSGHWVACTHDHLVTAVRFLLAQERLKSLRTASPKVDASSVGAQIQRIRTAIARMRNISAKVAEVRGGADAIQTEAEAIRDDIRNAL